jgi:hypothetical protein
MRQDTVNLFGSTLILRLNTALLVACGCIFSCILL